MTSSMAMSRRYLLAAGAGSPWLVAVRRSDAGALVGRWRRARPTRKEIGPEVVMRGVQDTKDWSSVDSLAADDFTFSSAAGDDHISKTTFKAQCWDTQSALIDRFELGSVLDNANEAFVKYVCRTKSGKAIRNVERFTFKGDKIAALECYFGNQAGYPSAANKAG